jgi:hypothetical protein
LSIYVGILNAITYSNSSLTAGGKINDHLFFIGPLRILLLNNKQEIKTQAANSAKSQKIF